MSPYRQARSCFGSRCRNASLRASCHVPDEVHRCTIDPDSRFHPDRNRLPDECAVIVRLVWTMTSCALAGGAGHRALRSPSIRWSAAIVLEVINTGASDAVPSTCLPSPDTFRPSALLGGEAGVAFLQHFIAVREQFHSNILGLGVSSSAVPATESAATGPKRGHGIPKSSGTRCGRSGALAEILGLQVRQQALTLAITDSFKLIAWAVDLLLDRRGVHGNCVPTQYQQITAAPAKAA